MRQLQVIVMNELLTYSHFQGALRGSALVHSIHVAGRGRAAPRIQTRLLIGMSGSPEEKKNRVSMN